MSDEQNFGLPQDGGYGYPSPPRGAPGNGYLPQPAAGYGQPAAPQGQGAMLVSIGDIAVMSDAIMTPAGSLPLRGTVWTVADMSRTEEKMPTYAVVLAIIFFIFCLLGLFFLLIKEKKTTGHIQVTVHGGGRYHATMIPATGPGTLMNVTGQVNYARSLCA